MILAVISLEGGALTVALAAVGSYVGMKVAQARHDTKIAANTDRITENKQTLDKKDNELKEEIKDLEGRVRAVERGETGLSTEVKSIFKAIEKLGDKIDER